MVECPECGAGADLTKDGNYAHCASCECPTSSACLCCVRMRALTTLCLGNTIFEPGKEGSHYRGSGSGSGDKEEVKKNDGKEGEGQSKG